MRARARPARWLPDGRAPERWPVSFLCVPAGDPSKCRERAKPKYPEVPERRQKRTGAPNRSMGPGQSNDRKRQEVSSSQTGTTMPTTRPLDQSAAGGRTRFATTTAPTATATATTRFNYLVILQLIVNMALARAQCPDKTMTSFERIGGVTIKDAPLTILFTAPNNTGHPFAHLAADLNRQLGGPGSAPVYPITAECNNRCRRSAKCRAFLVDYSRHSCWAVEHSAPVGQAPGGLARAPTPILLAPTNERTAYFEKVCLNLPSVDCERAWIFERTPGYHIQGHDDKRIDYVPSRLKCQEYCLNERDFKCRSGEYDNLTMQCRLSTLDRHLKPALFQPTTNNVDYFENQCVPVANQCDSFDRFDDRDLGRAEIMRLTNSSDQCQQYCTQTIKAFICRSFTWSPATGKCYLNSANTLLVGGEDKLLHAPGLVYFQRNDCIDLRLECDTQAMTLNLRTNEPFRGRMYVRDEPNACETLGRSALVSSLSIPFQSQARCATRELPSRYSSVVVVQQHPLIQRKSDRYIKLVCDFQTANKTITSAYNVVANPWTSTALINATSFAPKIRLRITDKFGNDITGAKLGDELQLRIEAESESVYDMVARSVLAKSGTTDESIVLIDRDGCPADFRIFPPLRKLNKRVIIGKFDAFKFSSDVVVRFQVDVQFCLNSCPPTSCDSAGQASLLTSDEPLLAGSPAPDTYSAAGSLTTVSPASGHEQASPGVGQHQASTRTPQRQHQDLDQFIGSLGVPDSPGARRASLMHRPAANQPLPGPQEAAQQLHSDGQTFEAAQPRHSGGRAADQRDGAARENATRQQQAPLASSGLAQGQHQAPAAGGEPAAGQGRVSHQAQGQHQEAVHRRRRRAAEPLPAEPKHVPLQREIIVIEGPQQAPDGPDEPRARSAGARQPRRDARTGAGRTSGPNKDDNRLRHWEPEREPAPVGQQHQQQQFANSDSSSNNNKRALLCTTWSSLVFSILAFCTLQLLTIGLCVAAWLHRQGSCRTNGTGHQANNLMTNFKAKHQIGERLY